MCHDLACTHTVQTITTFMRHPNGIPIYSEHRSRAMTMRLTSKSRRANPLERPNRPIRSPKHALRHAQHGPVGGAGSAASSGRNNARTNASRPAIDLCVDVRRPVRLAAAAFVVGWHGGGGGADAVVAPAGHIGQQTASIGGDRRRKAQWAKASGRKARLWVEGRLQGGPRTSRAADKVSEVAKIMGKSNAVE